MAQDGGKLQNGPLVEKKKATKANLEYLNPTPFPSVVGKEMVA